MSTSSSPSLPTVLAAAPVLQTARLRLRLFQASDLEDYAGMLADPEVVQFLGSGKPRTRHEAWEAMLRASGHWALLGYGLFAIEREGCLVGHAGVINLPGWPQPELAYALARAAQGQGVASEALRAVFEWVAEDPAQTVAQALSVCTAPWGQPPSHRSGEAPPAGPGALVSYIRPANTPSIAVARRLGASLEGYTELLGIPVQVWRYPRLSQRAAAM